MSHIDLLTRVSVIIGGCDNPQCDNRRCNEARRCARTIMKEIGDDVEFSISQSVSHSAAEQWRATLDAELDDVRH